MLLVPSRRIAFGQLPKATSFTVHLAQYFCRVGRRGVRDLLTCVGYHASVVTNATRCGIEPTRYFLHSGDNWKRQVFSGDLIIIRC